MPANDQDVRALTYLACRIRKETTGCREWDDAGTYAVIAELLNHNLAETIERVTRHAADPAAKTPGAIRRPFVPPAPVAGPRTNARAGSPDECRTHPGEHAHTCRLCPTERYSHEQDPQPTADVSAGVALREALAARNRNEGDR